MDITRTIWLNLLALCLISFDNFVFGRFEYSEFCAAACRAGRGGNACGCTAIHFAGKRNEATHFGGKRNDATHFGGKRDESLNFGERRFGAVHCTTVVCTANSKATLTDMRRCGCPGLLTSRQQTIENGDESVYGALSHGHALAQHGSDGMTKAGKTRVQRVSDLWRLLEKTRGGSDGRRLAGMKYVTDEGRVTDEQRVSDDVIKQYLHAIIDDKQLVDTDNDDDDDDDTVANIQDYWST